MNGLLKIAFGVIIVLLCNSCEKTQKPFQKEIKPFKFLENAIKLNDTTPWGALKPTYKIPIGFTYNFLGKNFDSLHLETTGRIIFDDEHLYFADAFSEISMQDAGFGFGSSKSPIQYKNEQLKNEEVLIIEFKNASFTYDTISKISFQIRLYKNSGDFELHMGPSKISDFSKTFKKGPFSGVNYIKSFNPTRYNYRVAAHGNPENPEIIIETAPINDTKDFSITRVPIEGTVYRFSTSVF